MRALAVALLAQAGLQSVIEEVRDGDIARAWVQAESLAGPLERAQARLYVRHHSGDLVGAWQEARTATRAFPDDAWLGERALYIATSLGRAHDAQSALAHLDEVLARASPRERADYAQVVDTARGDVAQLVASAEARRDAERRAHVVVAIFGLGALLGFVLLARGRPDQRMSSTPAEPNGSNKVVGGIQ